MKLVYAKDPVWANRSKTLINVTARFEEIEEDLPFTANPDDTEEHGRDIYAKALEGEFGEVAPFDPPQVPLDYVEWAVREIRNEKLQTEVDPIVTNPLRWGELSPEQQQAYSNYRRALLDITEDPAFPWYDLIVVETDYGFDVNPALIPWPTLSI
jgi:hypothetical protein